MSSQMSATRLRAVLCKTSRLYTEMAGQINPLASTPAWVGSPLELEPAAASIAAPSLVHATPLVGGTVLKAPLPGTILPGGGALPGAATVFTQNQMGRTKASQQRTILVTVSGKSC